MKLQAVFQIDGLKKVLTGPGVKAGTATPGSLYEVDDETGSQHIAEGYAVLPGTESKSGLKEAGPKIREVDQDEDSSSTLEDIAPRSEAKGKGKGAGKAAGKAAAKGKAAVVVEPESTSDLDDDLGIGTVE